MKLTAKQTRFADEYLVDLNATQAYKRAGYKVATDNAAGVEGHKLLKNPKIAEYIAERQLAREKRTEITQDMVLQRWWAIATADPNELVIHRRVCCRHCFGIDHGYQWIDEVEYGDACAVAAMNDKPAPSDEGGYGFDPTIRPHPKCPQCFGEGKGQVKAADSRDLSESGKLLYAGAKSGMFGVEIKMRDQDKALENVARHLGMFKDKLELSGELTQNIRPDLSKLSDEELIALEQLLAKSSESG